MPNALLRHTLSTIEYRFQKSVEGAPPEYPEVSLGNGSRTPTEILRHMYEILERMRKYLESGTMEITPLVLFTFEGEIQRFEEEIANAIEVLGAMEELSLPFAKKLIQGPLSDILTHIGQLAMLRRMADDPIKGEDFSRARIGG